MSAETSREPMRCTADDRDEQGVGRCPCSLVTATGGACGVFGPPPTFAEAFPYLTPRGQAGADPMTLTPHGEPRCPYVAASVWGPARCVLPEGHTGRHAYGPTEGEG